MFVSDAQPDLLATWCRSYVFVVKGGEEVRLDERVQTLFSMMNRLTGAQMGRPWSHRVLPVCKALSKVVRV